MAGTVIIVHTPPVRRHGRIVATCTADASDGSFPAIILPPFDGRLLGLHTNPGATAPTDNWDVVLTDGDGMDRLQGVGANRDTVNSEQVPVVYAGTAISPPVMFGDVLSLAITGNVVNSAGIVLTLFYQT